MNQKVVLTGFLLVASLAAACTTAQQPQTVNTNVANTAVVARSNENSAPLIATSHSSQTAQTNSPGAVKPNSPTATGQGRAIDTTELDAAIAKAEKDYQAKPKDEAAKKALAAAYAERALALTEAAQYRSALGDFRKSLKLNPTNQTAQSMHDEIIRIFAQMEREMPAPGEEPTPLPYKKDA